MKITTTWNALPNEVVTSITVNSFENSLDKQWAENPLMSELTGSNHRCRAQFKCAQTVIGQRLAGNGPKVCPTTTTTTTTNQNNLLKLNELVSRSRVFSISKYTTLS